MSSLIVVLLLAANWPRTELPVKLMHGETSRKHLPATMAGGVAVFDYDGDGRLDIFVANGGELPSGRKTSPAHANRLFRNLGRMQFADVTAKAGVGGTEFSFAAAADDYDGDGHPDLLVTKLRGLQLLRNRGDGTFEDTTAKSGLTNAGRWAVGAAWLDYDHDGRLDLFILNYVRWDAAKEPECRTAGRIDFCHPRYYDPQPNALWRNLGGGRFEDVSEKSGIARHKGKGMGVAVADFNADGRLDLFITNDRLPAFLLAGRANGTFDEIAFESNVAVPEDGKNVSAMGVDAQDVNGDGRIDLIYTALKDETWPFYFGGKDSFEPQVRFNPLARRYAGWGVQFADLNQDGQLDAVGAASDALSGVVDPARKGPVVWFPGFARAEEVAEPAMHRGLVAADFDGDGCTDLVVSALGEPVRILRNPCTPPGTAAARTILGSTTVGYASSYKPVR
jgi:hypothetical protein